MYLGSRKSTAVKALIPDQVAVKVLRRTFVKKHFNGLRTELEMLGKVQGHPNVLKLIGVFSITSSSNLEESDGEDLADDLQSDSTNRWAIVTDFYRDGDFFEFLDTYGALPPDACLEFACGLVSALTHIHALRIVHRDVKGENILLGPAGRPILADFGISASIDDEIAMKSPVGSPGYVAPEVISGQRYNDKADVYSLGVVLYVALTNRLPFSTTDPQKQLLMTVKSKIDFPAKRFKSVPRGFLTVLKAFLLKEPELRPTCYKGFAALWAVAPESMRELPTMQEAFKHIPSTHLQRSVESESFPASPSSRKPSKELIEQEQLKARVDLKSPQELEAHEQLQPRTQSKSPQDQMIFGEKRTATSREAEQPTADDSVVLPPPSPVNAPPPRKELEAKEAAQIVTRSAAVGQGPRDQISAPSVQSLPPLRTKHVKEKEAEEDSASSQKAKSAHPPAQRKSSISARIGNLMSRAISSLNPADSSNKAGSDASKSTVAEGDEKTRCDGFSSAEEGWVVGRSLSTKAPLKPDESTTPRTSAASTGVPSSSRSRHLAPLSSKSQGQHVQPIPPTGPRRLSRRPSKEG